MRGVARAGPAARGSTALWASFSPVPSEPGSALPLQGCPSGPALGKGRKAILPEVGTAQLAAAVPTERVGAGSRGRHSAQRRGPVPRAQAGARGEDSTSSWRRAVRALTWQSRDPRANPDGALQASRALASPGLSASFFCLKVGLKAATIVPEPRTPGDHEGFTEGWIVIRGKLRPGVGH